jgi:hypothetical protein
MASPAENKTRGLGSCLVWVVVWAVVLGALAWALWILVLVVGMSMNGNEGDESEMSHRLSNDTVRVGL